MNTETTHSRGGGSIWCAGHMDGVFQTNTVASSSISNGALSRVSAWLRQIPGVRSMWDLQCSVARQGVGAHLHTHKAVANAQIFGQKRWFLCPPSSPMNVRVRHLFIKVICFVCARASSATHLFRCCQGSFCCVGGEFFEPPKAQVRSNSREQLFGVYSNVRGSEVVADVV